MEKSDAGYIVCLTFKDTTRPSVNYRNAKGQLNSLIQKVSHDANLGKQYDDILNTYVEKEFIEEIPTEPIAGHYMPLHPVFKKSTTTHIRIVFNASSPLMVHHLMIVFLQVRVLQQSYMISCSHSAKGNTLLLQIFPKRFTAS